MAGFIWRHIKGLALAAMRNELEEARNAAFEEAARMAILTGNHISILPPATRKFPQAGHIIASRILLLSTSKKTKTVNEIIAGFSKEE